MLQLKRTDNVKPYCKITKFIFLGYIEYLCCQFPEVIEESINNIPSNNRQFLNRLKVTAPIKLNCPETAEMLIGKCSLSQRGYKSLRAILSKNEIKILKYEAVRKFCLSTDVGSIVKIHENEIACEKNCMGVKTNLHETLQLIIQTPKLFEKFEFMNEEQQLHFFNYLKNKDPNLYKNLNPAKRSLFLKETGDNFRAASRYPTEQTSFSLVI